MNRVKLVVATILVGVVLSGLPATLVAADDHLPTGKVEGTVTNLAVGKSEKVRFVLSSKGNDKRKVRAKGSYSNKQLFGKFDVTGRVINRTDTTTSLQFTGFIELGDDDSGFPKGTKAEYVMTLLVRGTEIKGVYRIAPMPDFELDFEQHGTMELKIVKMRGGRHTPSQVVLPVRRKEGVCCPTKQMGLFEQPAGVDAHGDAAGAAAA